MATSYATYQEYVERTGDAVTSQERFEATAEDLSAELRAELGVADAQLTGDAAILARRLVIDAARKALVPPVLDGLDCDLTGASQASFTSNGFTGSVTLSNPYGSAWFDGKALARLKRLLGCSQRWGFVFPYGG